MNDFYRNSYNVKEKHDIEMENKDIDKIEKTLTLEDTEMFNNVKNILNTNYKTTTYLILKTINNVKIQKASGNNYYSEVLNKFSKNAMDLFENLNIKYDLLN